MKDFRDTDGWLAQLHVNSPQLNIPNIYWSWLFSILISKSENSHLSYVFTLRLIGPISYPDECDLTVHPRKYSVIFSHECILLPLYVHNMHQDTKSARLIAVCKRTFLVCYENSLLSLGLGLRLRLAFGLVLLKLNVTLLNSLHWISSF